MEARATGISWFKEIFRVSAGRGGEMLVGCGWHRDVSWDGESICNNSKVIMCGLASWATWHLILLDNYIQTCRADQFAKCTQFTRAITYNSHKGKWMSGKKQIGWKRNLTKFGCNSGRKRHGMTNWAHVNNLHPLLDTKVNDFILRLWTNLVCLSLVGNSGVLSILVPWDFPRWVNNWSTTYLELEIKLQGE